MKNKLLISTALVSSLVAAQTASYAEAKISGSVEYTYNSVEDTTTDSSGSLGSESTVKFSGSKDADIGTITTSFKLEEAAIEAPVISIANGDTTVGVGADFAPSLSFTNIPLIGDRSGTVGSSKEFQSTSDDLSLYSNSLVASHKSTTNASTTSNYHHRSSISQIYQKQ